MMRTTRKSKRHGYNTPIKQKLIGLRLTVASATVLVSRRPDKKKSINLVPLFRQHRSEGSSRSGVRNQLGPWILECSMRTSFGRYGLAI